MLRDLFLMTFPLLFEKAANEKKLFWMIIRNSTQQVLPDDKAILRYLIFIEGIKHNGSKITGIPKWKELSVDTLKTL